MCIENGISAVCSTIEKMYDRKDTISNLQIKRMRTYKSYQAVA